MALEGTEEGNKKILLLENVDPAIFFQNLLLYRSSLGIGGGNKPALSSETVTFKAMEHSRFLQNEVDQLVDGFGD